MYICTQCGKKSIPGKPAFYKTTYRQVTYPPSPKKPDKIPVGKEIVKQEIICQSCHITNKEAEKKDESQAA